LGRRAVPALSQALKDKDRTIRNAAVRILCEIGPDAKGGLPALLAATKDGDPLFRGEAAFAVTRVSPDDRKTAVAVMLSLMKENAADFGGSEKEAASGIAQRNLVTLGEPVVPWLIEALRDENAILRGNVTTTLGMIGPPAKQAIKPLFKNLDDKVPVIRIQT